MYEENLDRCDVVLWVMSARNRAVALDQMYLRKLSRFHDRIVLAISQADLVEPLDWVEKYNIPSSQQEEERRHRGRPGGEDPRRGRPFPSGVSYSAHRGYQLEKLFTTILRSCPVDRQWIYGGLKNFSYKDFLPSDRARKLAEHSGNLLGRFFNGQ